MPHIHVINSIVVPEGMEEEAVRVRDHYISYFQRQPGFVSSTFYKALDVGSSFHFVNVVVWDSQASFDAVVNSGFDNIEGLNDDAMKVLGRGFPEPIKVSPGRYEIIREDGGDLTR